MGDWLLACVIHADFPKVRNRVFKGEENMDNKDCCYEEMTKSVGGQSIPSEYHEQTYTNSYEEKRKGYDVNGLDQSGMKKGK